MNQQKFQEALFGLANTINEAVKIWVNQKEDGAEKILELLSAASQQNEDAAAMLKAIPRIHQAALENLRQLLRISLEDADRLREFEKRQAQHAYTGDVPYDCETGG